MKTIQITKHVLLSLFVVFIFNLPAVAESEQAIAEQQVSTTVIQVDINTASEAELSQLAQVGPKKAQEIVRFREAHGRFKSVDDLVLVKGIGIKTVEKNRQRLLAGQ